MVEGSSAQRNEHLTWTGHRVRDVFVPKHLRPAVLVDANRFHGHNPVMTAAELTLVGAELGLDAIGASPAEPYVETEAHIHDRRERGLFAGDGVHDSPARGLLSP